jgi:Na+/proline symporter
MVIISCVVFCILTLRGGAWSVTVTDTAMMCIILFVAFALFPLALKFNGGWETIMTGQFAEAPARFTWTGAGLTAGGAISTIFIWMCGMFAGPHQSSRILIAKDEKTAIKGIILVVSLGMMAVWSLHIMGHGLWSVTKDIKPADQALIYLFKNLPNTFMGAMGISALFAAALSTTTTMLLTLSMGVGKDLYRRLNPQTADDKVLRITKYAVIGWTVVVFIAAYNQSAALAKWGELGSSVFACVYFPPLLLGLNWKRVTKPAVYASMIVGGAVDIVLWIAWRYGDMPLIMGLQPVIYGIASAFIALVVTTLMTTPTTKEIEIYEKWEKPLPRTVPDGVGQIAATAESKPDNFKYYCAFAVLVGLAFIIGGLTLLPS